MSNFNKVSQGGNPNVKRDRWGRPMLIPANGGPRTGYQRVTTLAKMLEDTSQLTKWKQRMVAIGMVTRPDLVALAAASGDNAASLNAICEDAEAAAKADSKANYGTAIHSFTEMVDRNEKPVGMPAEARTDVIAYLEARRRCGIKINPEEIEIFVANDEIGVAGTADRIIEMNGKRYIADVKTGSVKFGTNSMAMQLAIYANSTPYDLDTDTWGEPLDVDLETGYIIHLPAGTGTCNIIPIDIRAGWRAARVATWVREWRKTPVLGDKL